MNKPNDLNEGSTVAQSLNKTGSKIKDAIAAGASSVWKKTKDAYKENERKYQRNRLIDAADRLNRTGDKWSVETARRLLEPTQPNQ